MRKASYLFCVLLPLLFLFSACDSVSKNWSVPKHSEATNKDYQETSDGYKAAFYTKDEITIDEVKSWLDLCEVNGKYYQYTYSDSDSWDLFVLFPYDSTGANKQYKFRFYVSADSNSQKTVNIYLESSEKPDAAIQNYILLRVQAPSKGAWPTSQKLFIDGKEIELQKGSKKLMRSIQDPVLGCDYEHTRNIELRRYHIAHLTQYLPLQP